MRTAKSLHIPATRWAFCCLRSEQSRWTLVTARRVRGSITWKPKRLQRTWAGNLRGVLRMVLPKGSLERATLELFEAADLPVHRNSSVDYQANIDDPRIDSVRILRPQEIPTYVAEGLFDIGITGRDWVEETGSVVHSLGELKYSKNTSKPIRMVVAVAGDSAAESVKDLPNGVRVQTEYLESTRRYFEANGVEANIRLSYGATEAKIPDIADCVVEITETGRALRAAGLKVIDTILTSYTEVVVNPEAYANPQKRKAMEQIMTLLNGVLDARGKVLLKLNVSDAQKDAVLAVLPSMKSPTVSPLSGGGVAVESVIEKSTINLVIPALLEAGATDLVEMPISKIVP
jgi:ATP phosphoribosyltransferase